MEVLSSFYLFVFSRLGLIPLAVIAFCRGQSIVPFDVMTAIGIIPPVLAQEVFLLGYVQSRLGDVFAPATVISFVVCVFLLAHLSHAQDGICGTIFVMAMGLQGFIWSAARFSFGSLLPLIAAHAALLALYFVPVASILMLAAFVSLTVVWDRKRWADMIQNLRHALRAPIGNLRFDASK